jgi:hypothetical protein
MPQIPVMPISYRSAQRILSLLDDQASRSNSIYGPAPMVAFLLSAPQWNETTQKRLNQKQQFICALCDKESASCLNCVKK